MVTISPVVFFYSGDLMKINVGLICLKQSILIKETGEMNRIMTITRIVGRLTNMADSQTTFVTTSTDISANSRPRQVQNK